MVALPLSMSLIKRQLVALSNLDFNSKLDEYFDKLWNDVKIVEVVSTMTNNDRVLRYKSSFSALNVFSEINKFSFKKHVLLKHIDYNHVSSLCNKLLCNYWFYLLLVIGLLFIFVCIYWYNRKIWKTVNNELISKLESMHINMDCLKLELSQKKKQMSDLQKCFGQLNEDLIHEKQLSSSLQDLLVQYREKQDYLEKQINEKDKELIRLKSLNLKSQMTSSISYNKLIEICDYNNHNPDNMKKISCEEWKLLLKDINDVSFGFIDRLLQKYEKILDNDICFCCLVKLEFKYSDIALIWGCSTVAVYKRSHSILEKMQIANARKLKLIDVLDKV